MEISVCAEFSLKHAGSLGIATLSTADKMNVSVHEDEEPTLLSGRHQYFDSGYGLADIFPGVFHRNCRWYLAREQCAKQEKYFHNGD